jgi:hypothetical protein
MGIGATAVEEESEILCCQVSLLYLSVRLGWCTHACIKLICGTLVSNARITYVMHVCTDAYAVCMYVFCMRASHSKALDFRPAGLQILRLIIVFE